MLDKRREDTVTYLKELVRTLNNNDVEEATVSHLILQTATAISAKRETEMMDSNAPIIADIVLDS